MIAICTNKRLRIALLATLATLLAGVSAARAEELYTGPVKEIPSSAVGGFEEAKGVAVNEDKASPQHGDVYVIDGSHRVRELAADGSFVRVFGWDVNKTKVEKGGATQPEMNVCTEVEIKAGGECQPGVEGPAPGQFGEEQTSIAVDPTSGAVYVADRVKGTLGVGHTTNGVRVQEFSSAGEWLGEIGKEVNKTKVKEGGTAQEKNLCTQSEIEAKGVECTGPAQYQFGTEPPSNSTEPGVFPLGVGEPTLVAAGGPEDLLYVGSQARIQEFVAAGGDYKRELPLAAPIRRMAFDDSCQLLELTGATNPTCASFDPSYGGLYVVYGEQANVVHKLAADGKSLAEFPLSSRTAGAQIYVVALAVDPFGRLAVSEREELLGGYEAFGSLLAGASGHLITEFKTPEVVGLAGLAFSTTEQMYGVVNAEAIIYTSVHVAELRTGAASCAPGADAEANATFNCALNGQVNPEKVEDTSISFEWGLTPTLGEVTPVSVICTTLCGETLEPAPAANLTGVRPNQLLYYRLAGHDKNVTPPELLTGETASHQTPIVNPRIVGQPSAPAVTSSSAVMFAELNPENAPTEYFFEYGASLAGYCESPLRTGKLESAVYGTIGATLEARGLQPATPYRYRLCASDEAGKAGDEHGGSEIKEGEFTTAPAPLPQAVTGSSNTLGTTTATITGTVNPDGQPATYAFELGLYEGAATQYEIVFSGPAGTNTTPVEETLALTGLQPGTAYAYRIAIKSGYGQSTGATLTFTTAGLQNVLPVPVPLGLLPIPPYKFPKGVPTPRTVKCKHGYGRDKHGKCVKIKGRKTGKRHGSKAKKARHARPARRP